MTVVHTQRGAGPHRSEVHTIDTGYLGIAGLAAAYLRVEGDEAAFIEASTAHALPRLLAALDGAGLRREQVRWVIVTHAHLDHAGGASALMEALPRATLLAHPRAARHLIDPSRLVASASQVYGEQRFAELYGVIAPIDAARVRALDDGATEGLGGATLQFFHTRGHANHHFIVADRALSAVYTGDTFGLVYPGLQGSGLVAFPSTSPTDFDADEARKSVQRVLDLGAEVAYPTHFGPVRDLAGVAGQLRRWLDLSAELVAGARAAGNPPDTEGRIRGRLEEEMTRALGGLALSPEGRSLLDLDLGLNAQGLAFAARRG